MTYKDLYKSKQEKGTVVQETTPAEAPEKAAPAASLAATDEKVITAPKS